MAHRVLRPHGRVRGEAADQAVRQGLAWRLADGSATTHLEVFDREGGATTGAVMPVPAFLAGLARAATDEHEEWLGRLRTLTAGVAWPVELPPPPLIMGVVNVTPDSFHDGGRYQDPARAVEQGRRLAAEGAAIVDVGGESTRPGSAPVPVEEEIRRVEPVVRALAADGIRVSIDSRHAATMRAALDAGATLVNDVSALGHDPAAVNLVAARGVPVILMHMQGEPSTMQQAPSYRRACLDVLDILEDRAGALEAAGIGRDRLILDPGIGFGKSVGHNLDILRHLDLYACLGRAVALGVSRKSFIARLSAGEPTSERLPGSLAVNLAAATQGVGILRVHDVAATLQALHLWRSLANGSMT